MQSLPVFSIVTVVLNDICGFRETKHSVLSQLHKALEWIVVDGGSTDGTSEEISATTFPMLQTISEPDDGLYDAMNKGIDLCSGQYVIFMNAGDVFWSSNTLQAIDTSLNHQATKPDVILGSALISFENGREYLRTPRVLEKTIWHGLPAVHQATLYKVDRLRKCNYSLRYSICSDYYLISKLFGEGIETLYLEEVICRFKVGGVSYQNHGALFFEPWAIQRDILKMNVFVRAVSLIRRVATTAIQSVMRQY